MRKNLLMFGVFCLAANMMAQSQKNDTTLRWKFPTIINISLSQTSFSNWSAGGENSYAVNGLFLSDLNYKDTSKLWENNFTLAYGLMKQGDKEVRKTDDKLEFSSKFGYRASKSWYYSILMQFKTQFSNGYQYDDNAGTKTKLSGFMSPGFLSLAIGMNYAPSKAFSLFIGPLSGKSTMVIDEELSNKKAFGVDSGKHI